MTDTGHPGPPYPHPSPLPELALMAHSSPWPHPLPAPHPHHRVRTIASTPPRIRRGVVRIWQQLRQLRRAGW